jgi:hypothetical protein
MTASEFLARAPEFRTFYSTATGGSARVDAALADATARTDATVFGVHTDAAIFYLAAHLLAASPANKDARLKGEGFVSVYLEERRRIENLVAPMLALTLDVC